MKPARPETKPKNRINNQRNLQTTLTMKDPAQKSSGYSKRLHPIHPQPQKTKLECVHPTHHTHKGYTDTDKSRLHPTQPTINIEQRRPPFKENTIQMGKAIPHGKGTENKKMGGKTSNIEILAYPPIRNTPQSWRGHGTWRWWSRRGPGDSW